MTTIEWKYMGNIIAALLVIIVGIAIIIWTVGLLFDILGAVLIIAAAVWLVRVFLSRNSRSTRV